MSVVGQSRHFGTLPSTSGSPPGTDMAPDTQGGLVPCPWKHIETPATSETAPLSAVPNRRQSNILGLRHVIGYDFIAPRRSNSAHLRRPWRAIISLFYSAIYRLSLSLQFSFIRARRQLGE